MKYVTTEKHLEGSDDTTNCMVARCVNESLKSEYVADVGVSFFDIVPRDITTLCPWDNSLWEYILPAAVQEEIVKYLHGKSKPGFKFEIPIPQEFLKNE